MSELVRDRFYYRMQAYYVRDQCITGAAFHSAPWAIQRLFEDRPQ